MFHSNTERLIDYWRSRRGEDLLPARTAIDPGAFSDLLPQVFILGRDAPGRYPFRLSGGFVANLHGRELKGEQGLPLWTRMDRTRVQSALELARASAEPIVVNTQVSGIGIDAFPMEVFIAPLAGAGGQVDRFLGLYQPTGMVPRLEEDAHRELAVTTVVSADTADELEPRLRLAVIDGRQIA